MRRANAGQLDWEAARLNFLAHPEINGSAGFPPPTSAEQASAHLASSSPNGQWLVASDGKQVALFRRDRPDDPPQRWGDWLARGKVADAAVADDGLVVVGLDGLVSRSGIAPIVLLRAGDQQLREVGSISDEAISAALREPPPLADGTRDTVPSGRDALGVQRVAVSPAVPTGRRPRLLAATWEERVIVGRLEEKGETTSFVPLPGNRRLQNKSVVQLAFDPTGSTLLAVDRGRGGKRVLGFWARGADGADLAPTGQQIPFQATSTAFYPLAPHDTLACGDERGRVHFINWSATLASDSAAAPVEEWSSVQLDKPVATLAFRADGSSLLAGCADGSMGLWKLADRQWTPQKLPAVPHERQIVACAIEADSAAMSSMDVDGHCGWWPRPELLRDTVRWPTAPVTAMDVRRTRLDVPLEAATFDRLVHLHREGASQVRQTRWIGHTKAAPMIVRRPGPEIVSATFGETLEICRWDAESGRMLSRRNLFNLPSPAKAYDWSSDGRWGAAESRAPGDARRVLYLVDLTTGEHSVHDFEVTALRFAPDSRAVVIGLPSGAVKVLSRRVDGEWSATGDATRVLLNDRPVRVLAFSPDGSWLAAACESTHTATASGIKVWQFGEPQTTARGSTVLEADLPQGGVSTLALSNQQLVVVEAEQQRRLHVYDIRGG
ncbi:MAG TPA: WD40 repeat domain-containing protein, partial [Lacipirellulaceae bacterium]|nr:WD40 repeat domain-containing protein [Lacipirellulaceae bacterium]